MALGSSLGVRLVSKLCDYGFLFLFVFLFIIGPKQSDHCIQVRSLVKRIGNLDNSIGRDGIGTDRVTTNNIAPESSAVQSGSSIVYIYY
ncbi:hypothetical protein BP00DRAFT_133598 [Aspergillus indologenus CBS 114.80]|uniref:Uncharacterized protein n=1 Tax=Aspergillus indologenus CBS 114.80 TaxID=1450541 RepID=A0A2V5IXD3_9EURO|nr:hypothetical protein BP00DRAFT_133598 [Aspergillus indologenus CBS 114.80]